MTTLAAVVPCFDASNHLEAVLAPLLAARERAEIQDVVLVDDGSGDGSADIARRLGASVLQSGGRLGPAMCRNLAVDQVDAQWIWFVDADVVVHDDAARRVREHAESGTVVGVFGSYDDTPHAPGWISRVRNLLHHHVHQTHAGPVASFWAGCGAVQRRAFLAVGGFAVRRFPRPAIEDVELGARLAGQGTIVLDPSLLATHRKCWTLTSMLRTDVGQRALPWARWIVHDRAPMAALNVDGRARMETALAVLAPSCAVAGLWWAPAFIGAAAGWASAAWLDRGFLSLVRRRLGTLITCGAFAFHQGHHALNAAVFGWVWIEQLWWRKRSTTR